MAVPGLSASSMWDDLGMKLRSLRVEVTTYVGSRRPDGGEEAPDLGSEVLGLA